MRDSDDEFEDFLKRRKPMFRAPDDLFEPPAELDRVVLRQAREAIETPQPLRMFSAPRWATPLALAATLVLGLTVVFQAGMPPKRTAVPEVTVQNVAQRLDAAEVAPPTAPAPTPANNRAREEFDSGGPVVVDLAPPAQGAGSAAPADMTADSRAGIVSYEEAQRHAAPPPPAAPMTARSVADTVARQRATTGTMMEAAPVVVAAPAGKSTEVPTWRRDSKTWLAEIERLRNAGDSARADAELAEYKRQQRAYAGAPDR